MRYLKSNLHTFFLLFLREKNWRVGGMSSSGKGHVSIMSRTNGDETGFDERAICELMIMIS